MGIFSDSYSWGAKEQGLKYEQLALPLKKSGI
jgi:hypothetical protein